MLEIVFFNGEICSFIQIIRIISLTFPSIIAILILILFIPLIFHTFSVSYNFICLCHSFTDEHSGSFSTIYKCKNSRKSNHVGKFVAIKEIDTRNLSIPQIRSIKYEMNILSQLQNHENIIRFHCIFTMKSSIYMVSTYVPHSVISYFMVNWIK